MAADEESNVQESKEQEIVTPAISGKGWMIVIGVVALHWILIGVWIYVGQTDTMKDSEDDKLSPKIPLEFVNKYTVPYEDLTYSKSSTGANKVNILMSLDMILGLTAEELDSSTGEYPSDEVMVKFKAAVESLQPDIKDYLQERIDNMTIQQLDKQEGKASIRRMLMDYVNERLSGINFPDIDKKWSRKRITAVKFTKFLIQ